VLAAASIHRAHEMTTTSGGNISVRDENGDVWITPARPFRTVKEMHETLYHFHEPKDEEEANA